MIEIHQYSCAACDDYDASHGGGYCERYSKFVNYYDNEVCNSNLSGVNFKPRRKANPFKTPLICAGLFLAAIIMFVVGMYIRANIGAPL